MSEPHNNMTQCCMDAMNHMRWQAEVRASTVPAIRSLLQAFLASAFPAVAPFRIRLYGSLHHGLYTTGSKINIDVAAATEDLASNTADKTMRVLSVLTAMLQQESKSLPHITHPVLLWHRTVHRPVMLLFYWKDIPVYVTFGNSQGVVASTFMWYVLAVRPLMRLTLLYWKTYLRRNTALLGPNAGQVSAYALFTIVYQNAYQLQADGLDNDFGKYERTARDYVVAHLQGRSHTPDLLAGHINLTGQAFTAPEMAEVLGALPPAQLSSSVKTQG